MPTRYCVGKQCHGGHSVFWKTAAITKYFCIPITRTCEKMFTFTENNLFQYSWGFKPTTMCKLQEAMKKVRKTPKELNQSIFTSCPLLNNSRVV